MILCVNTYRVKPGQRDALVADLGAGGDRRPAPGAAGECVLRLFPSPSRTREGLTHRCLGGDEAAFQAHLNHPATLRWGKLKATYITDSQVRRYDL